MQVKSLVSVFEARRLLLFEAWGFVFFLWIEYILEEIVDKSIALAIDSIILLFLFIVFNLNMVIVDIVLRCIIKSEL